MADVRYSHGTEIYVIRACYEEDGVDLLAVGGAHTVEILVVVSRRVSCTRSYTERVQLDLRLV